MAPRVVMIVMVVGCGSKPPAPVVAAAPPPPAPVAIDAAVPDAPIPPAPPPDPLAGKSAAEQWEWAKPQIAGLDDLVPQPQAADFAPLGLKNGKITLYTPHLELGLASKQLAPCTALPLSLDENGALATRIALDGSRVRTDLKDQYIAFSLGIMIDDHHAVVGDAQTGYADSGIGGYLSEVTAKGLRYEGSSRGFTVKCQNNVTTHHCADGSTKKCERCSAVTRENGVGYGTIAGLDSPHSECGPCPPDTVAPLIAPLDRVLQAHPMMRIDKGSGPTFYTRLADCKAAMKAH